MKTLSQEISFKVAPSCGLNETGVRIESPVVKIVEVNRDVVAKAPSLRDIQQLLILPVFSNSKKRAMDIYQWKSKDGKRGMTITPSATGRATIWDADLVIYIVTAVRRLLDRKQIEYDLVASGNLILSLSARQLLMFRSNIGNSDDDKDRKIFGGKNYCELIAALDRLTGTILQIRKDNQTTTAKLITEFGIVRGPSGRASHVEIQPSSFLLDHIAQASNILSVPLEYVGLSSAMERQLYRFCRCYAGKVEIKSISLEKLWIWCGRRNSLKKYRHYMRNLDDDGKQQMREILGFGLEYSEVSDDVLIHNRILAEALKKKRKCIDDAWRRRKAINKKIEARDYIKETWNEVEIYEC